MPIVAQINNAALVRGQERCELSISASISKTTGGISSNNKRHKLFFEVNPTGRCVAKNSSNNNNNYNHYLYKPLTRGPYQQTSEQESMHKWHAKLALESWMKQKLKLVELRHVKWKQKKN